MSNSFHPAASPASGATRAVGTESSLPSGHPGHSSSAPAYICLLEVWLTGLGSSSPGSSPRWAPHLPEPSVLLSKQPGFPLLAPSLTRLTWGAARDRLHDGAGAWAKTSSLLSNRTILRSWVENQVVAQGQECWVRIPLALQCPPQQVSRWNQRSPPLGLKYSSPKVPTDILGLPHLHLWSPAWNGLLSS